MSFVHVGVVKSILCISAQVNFYPKFPHSLSDLGEIRSSRSAHNAVGHLWFHENLRREGLTFLMEINKITFTPVGLP
jgi:hypothetical protein